MALYVVPHILNNTGCITLKKNCLALIFCVFKCKCLKYYLIANV